MSITWGDVKFEGPYRLTEWDPPRRAAVYAIMMQPDPKNKPRTYRILYFGECSNLSERGFDKSHDKYDCWLDNAGPDSNLYAGIHRMPNSTAGERQEVESALIDRYSAACND
jgi:hypothetical protein